MAWTTPQTWVAGAVGTAAEMNTHVRDNMNYLKGQVDGNSALKAEGTGSQTITTSYADITSASVTLDATGIWLIYGSAVVFASDSDNALGFYLNCSVGGTPEAQVGLQAIIGATNPSNGYLQLNATWIVSATSSDVAKIRIRCDATTTATVQTSSHGTWISAVLLGGA